MLLDMKLEDAEAAARREQEKMFIEYLMMVFSAPAQPGESEAFAREREKFASQLEPTHFKKIATKTARKRLVWSNIPPDVMAELENNPLRIGEEEGGH